MDINTAKDIAISYFVEHGGLEISKIYDTDTLWIFFGRKNGAIRYGSRGISIDKETKQIKPFVLPSDENFAILDSATLIEG